MRERADTWTASRFKRGKGTSTILWLLLFVIVIVAGIVLVARSEVEAASGSGAVRVEDVTSRAADRPPIGMWTLVFGLVALAIVAMVGQASFCWVAAFDPPDWLRIVTFWLFPVGHR